MTCSPTGTTRYWPQHDPSKEALVSAGFTVASVQANLELADLFDGFDQDMAEFDVSRDGEVVRLQLVRFDREKSPVIMEVGPVLHLDDLIGAKVAAMVTRAEPRDFLDVSAALAHHEPDELIALARRADPAITEDEIGDALRRLANIDDTVFHQIYGQSEEQIALVRACFAAWQRNYARQD